MRYTVILLLIVSACSVKQPLLKDYHFPYTLHTSDNTPLLVQAFHTEHATYLQKVQGARIKEVTTQEEPATWVTQGDFLVVDGVHNYLTVVATNGTSNYVTREQQ